MTSPESIFVDTNILIYATNPGSPWHRLAADTLNHHRDSQTNLVVSTQILREYIAAATRADAQGRLPSNTGILANVRAFEGDFQVLDDGMACLRRLIEIVTEVPVAGRQIHDASIVATMQVHGVGHLLTHNVAHFRRFADLISVIPLVDGGIG